MEKKKIKSINSEKEIKNKSNIPLQIEDKKKVSQVSVGETISKKSKIPKSELSIKNDKNKEPNRIEKLRAYKKVFEELLKRFGANVTFRSPERFRKSRKKII
jgi:hypothetical protein